MKTLIVFSSKYGTTESCSRLIEKELQGKVSLVNLKKEANVSIDEYDTILIGSPVYVGKVQKEIKSFIEKHQASLEAKNVGLFLCCNGEKQEDVTRQIDSNFPQWIVKRAIVKESVGYEIKFEKMNFMEKFVMKSIVKVKENVSKIDHDNIKKLTKVVNGMDVVNK